jgi:hypothetical protein
MLLMGSPEEHKYNKAKVKTLIAGAYRNDKSFEIAIGI